MILPACRAVTALGVIVALSVTAGDVWSKDEKPDKALLTIDRIYDGSEFKVASYEARWLDDGSGYTMLESAQDYPDRHDIIRHDPDTGDSEVLVEAADLIPAGESSPLKIDDYAWSKGMASLLVYTDSKRVWRQKSRGDYWVLDRSARQLRKLGGDASSSTLMFAKFSPTGRHVAYVRDKNIYLEDLRDHLIRPLTTVAGDEVINGTFDWVYEEEFGLRDGFQWSPDGQSIAYWQINTHGVPRFPLVNNTDSLYPQVTWFAYPKVGQRNPSCRVGVVDCATGKTRWCSLPGDSRAHYVPRIQWTEDSDHLLLQQLNRAQNRNRIFVVDVKRGGRQLILTEEDDAWIDIHDELKWVADGEHFTWISERDGWRHIYLVPTEGGEPRQVTSGEFDVIRLLHVDEEHDWIYFIASPDNASQRRLFRIGLDGRDLTQLTPQQSRGVHSYEISADSRWAIHRHSSADHPPVTDLVRLPDHARHRVLERNKKLTRKVAKLRREDTEFFQVDIGDGVLLDAWCIKPPDLDASKKYPLLVYVYGEPAGQTVVDQWGGSSYLWHLMMAQRGYVVMSIDNRGTKAPRGRAWRKSVYRKIGILPPRDQAAAVHEVLKQRPYLDPDRVGIWGWSGGGSSSLHAVFKFPELYSMAIAVAPVPNQRYYDTIYQERYMGLPESNIEGFRQGSPINFAKHLEGPLLIIHGTADDNCHYQTTEMLIDELVAHNKQFSLMAYPNRTHAVRERSNTTRHMRTLMTQFVLQNLPLKP